MDPNSTIPLEHRDGDRRRFDLHRRLALLPRVPFLARHADGLPRGAGAVVGEDREPTRAPHDLGAVLGDGQHEAVANLAQQLGGRAGERGRDLRDLVGDLVDVLEIEVGSQPQRELGCDPPVVHRTAGRRDLAPEPLDPALDVRDRALLLPPQGGGQDDVGVTRRLRQERVDGNHRRRPGERLTRERAVGEVAQRVAADEHEHVHASLDGRVQDPGCVQTGLVGNGAPRGSEHVAPGIERHAAGQHAGRETELDRAVHVGAAQSREKTDVGQRGERRRGAHRGVGAFGERTAAEHDDDGSFAITQQRGGTAEGVVAPCRGIAAALTALTRRSAATPASPGATWRSIDAGLNVEPTVEKSMTGTPSSTAALRTRRCRTGNSSLRSGPTSTIAAARSQSAISARGRPSTTSAGSPSASWASTWSVPITPFASRAHAYASSLLPRAPPSTAIAPGPCSERTRSSVAATESSASGHGVSTRSPRHAPTARPTAARRAGTRFRSGPCRTAIRGSRARSRHRGTGPAGSSTTGAPPGTAPRTSCTRSRPLRGPTGGRGSGRASQ